MARESTGAVAPTIEGTIQILKESKIKRLWSAISGARECDGDGQKQRKIKTIQIMMMVYFMLSLICISLFVFVTLLLVA